MKKIIMSLAIIGLTVITVIGGTYSYFSDTEVSTGNSFTAGSLDLIIDSECHYNGNECLCSNSYPYGCYFSGTTIPCGCNWEATDLDDEVLFSFGDIKPGDWGENTISFHVFDNDALGWIVITPEYNRENVCFEPEINDSDPSDITCGTGEFEGELAQNLYFSIWEDNGETEEWVGFDPCEPCNCPEGVCDDGEGDNIFQEEWEQRIKLCEEVESLYGNGEFCPVLSGTSTTTREFYIGRIDGGKTNYYGVEWKVPYSVGNIIQSDSMLADVSFRVVQARHNQEPQEVDCNDGIDNDNDGYIDITDPDCSNIVP